MRDELNDVCLAIRLGSIDAAEKQLDNTIIQDAASLNLLGAVHELRGEWQLARRCYGRAWRADRRFAAAERNLRRCYELWTFGQCREPLALGDERPALQRLLAWAESSVEYNEENAQRHQ